VGSSGVEFVEGEVEQGVLTLRGYKVDDRELLVKAEHTVVLCSGSDTFEGSSRARGFGGGTLRGSYSASP
jgi:hypothetical protein